MPLSRLLIATGNPGKFKELAALLADVPFQLVSLTDLRIESDPEEAGATFEENATIKAVAAMERSGLTSLADDSGLEVEALGGEPGVRSARYAGDDATDSERVAYLLSKLENIDVDLLARFRCVIAVASTGGDVDFFTGEVAGTIVKTPRGSNGFGYDPIFLVQGKDRTMAELTNDEKNDISHRASAARKAAAALSRVARSDNT